MTTHQSLQHVNAISVAIADDEWVTLERMTAGFFQCPLCLRITRSA